MLADALTRSTQTYNGAVSIGDNGFKGALYEYYLAKLLVIDPLKPAPVLLNPIFARTFISIDPSITFTGTVDDLVLNTHSLYTAAITQLAPADAGFTAPEITFSAAIGKIKPLYSINLLTMQSTNPSVYIGAINLKGEVNTFSNQDYRSATLTADPNAPSNVMTFTVDDVNAKISFDLFKATNGTYSLTNGNGLDTLIFNGPALFNGSTASPLLPAGKWTSVAFANSLTAVKIATQLAADQLAAAQLSAQMAADQLAAAQLAEQKVAVAPPAAIAKKASNNASSGIADVAKALSGIMNNTNFEVPKAGSAGTVEVAMGGSTRAASYPEVVKDDMVGEKLSSKAGSLNEVAKDEKALRNTASGASDVANASGDEQSAQRASGASTEASSSNASKSDKPADKSAKEQNCNNSTTNCDQSPR